MKLDHSSTSTIEEEEEEEWFSPIDTKKVICISEREDKKLLNEKTYKTSDCIYVYGEKIRK